MKPCFPNSRGYYGSPIWYTRIGHAACEAMAEILAQVESPQEQLVGEDSLRHALDECCRRLPDENRRMLAMRYEQDLPSLAIAEAIRVALYRIRARLKDCISHVLASEG